jgi:hypothetical protein
MCDVAFACYQVVLVSKNASSSRISNNYSVDAMLSQLLIDWWSVPSNLWDILGD